MNKPESWEYSDYYSDYVAHVPEGEVTELLGAEIEQWERLLGGVSEEQAESRPREDQWSIKEILGHLADAERVFGYRALCIARGDKTALPSFEQDEYVRESGANRRGLKSLLDEFVNLRRANIAMFYGLSPLSWKRTGTVSDGLMSVRALAYIIAGHEMRHLKLLRARLEAATRIHAAEHVRQ